MSNVGGKAEPLLKNSSNRKTQVRSEAKMGAGGVKGVFSDDLDEYDNAAFSMD